MKKKFLQKIKEKLEKEKSVLEEQLAGFAKRDEKLEEDWDTQYPQFDGGAGSQQLETEADEVEEYLTRLPIEYNLELRLKEVKEALGRIEKGIYGNCLKCGQKIAEKRLGVFPAAKFCLKCSKKYGRERP